ncbi:MAG: CRTAC1 family protein [Myxococcota bacterium]
MSSKQQRIIIVWTLVSVLLVACGGQKSATSTGGDAVLQGGDSVVSLDADADASGLTDVIDAAGSGDTAKCDKSVAWQAGTPIFAEATDTWGLSGIQGGRMSVLDVDGDGWADLLVRQGGGLNVFAPDGARDTWLMRNTGKGGFEDFTGASGLLQRRQNPKSDDGMGATVYAMGDVDNDGDADIYLGRSTAKGDLTVESSELLLNDGKGKFSLGPASSAARFAGLASVPMSASFVDFDRDGLLDLWVVHNMPGGANQPLQDRLLRGDGKGGFTDVTKEAGLTTVGWQSVPALNQAKGHSWAWSAAACDLNNDGLDELLVGSYGRVPNHLWRAKRGEDGKVSYVNESVASGYAYDDRMDWRDNLSAQCHCRDVPTDPECGTVPKPNAQVCASLAASFGPNYRWNHASDREPWRLGGNSGTTVCADVNNDGWFDLLTTEIVHSDVGSSADPSELLLNLGDPEVRLQRPGNEATGLVRKDTGAYWDHGDITAAIYDFDNDGWQDVHIAASDYPGNRALLFRQKAPLQFQEVETDDFFLRWRAAGVVAADFDRDGDLDVVTGHTRMRCEGSMGADCQDDDQIHLHLNQLGGRWLQVTLQGGEGSNRMAVGARVEVESGGVKQASYVDGGHGQSSTQRDPVLHFGLGQGCEAKVTVTWPNAARTVQSFVAQEGRRYRVVQGQDAVVVQK